MSDSFYEDTLLKEEYRLLVRLQQETEFSKYVTVSYEDRITGETQPLAVRPPGPRYPEKYIVEYCMSVYVSPGQLRRDWHGTATILLSESVLTNKHSRHGPHVTFHSNFEPFNNHLRRDSICSGNAWAAARDHGIWHFIISLGAIINQDEFVCADGGHMNGEAYDYWLARDRKPVTNIAWPLDLLSRGFSVRPVPSQPFTLETSSAAAEGQDTTIKITKVPVRLDIKPKSSALAPIVITPKKG